MDKEIKSENPTINDQNSKSLSEKKYGTIKKVEVTDTRLDEIDVAKISVSEESINNETFSRRPPYPWESENSITRTRKSPIEYIRNPRTPSIGNPSPRYFFRNVYATTLTKTISFEQDKEIFNSSGNSISDKIIRGKHGTLKLSSVYKDGPLIFVVGGIAIDDADLGKDSWYPGDVFNLGKSGKSKEGYVWYNGFNNLSNFHVYNCKKYTDAKEGWNEVVRELSSKGITITKKIIVGFSGGASSIYNVFSVEPASKWSIIHIVGPFMPNQDSATKHVNMINSIKQNGRIFYIQQGGIDSASEGATIENKKKIASLLPSSNIINSSSHIDGLKKSSQWILNNIKLNSIYTIKGEKNITETISSGNQIDKFGAKYKGTAGSVENRIQIPSSITGGITTRPSLSEKQLNDILKGGLTKKAVVGIRGYYLSAGKTQFNDRRIFDDALFIYDGHNVVGFNANTDPGGTGFNPTADTRKGFATLLPGEWQYKIGLHRGLYEALIEYGNVTVSRDAYGNTPRMNDTGNFGINIHRGGKNSVSSTGCQTIRPDQYEEFMTKIKSIWTKKDIIPYILFENTGKQLA